MSPLALVVLLALPAFSEPSWKTDAQAAFTEARKDRKPILIDFQAPWCYSCYYMEQRVLSKPGFAQAAKRLVLLKSDVDRSEGRDLRERYGARALPTYVLADGAGRVLGRIVGEQTESEFLRQLSALLKASAPADPGDRAVAALRQGLAARDLKAAASAARGLPAGQAAALNSRRDWRALQARFKLQQNARDPAQSSRPTRIAEALEILMREEDSCELAYDWEEAAPFLSQLPEERRLRLLEGLRGALEAMSQNRLFVPEAQRCADFRSGVMALAEVHEKMGDAAGRLVILKEAVKLLDRSGLRPGDDRNHDDNLRVFLELSGDEERLNSFYPALIAAYPADYVYAYRYGRWLTARGKAEEALPWLEKAALLSYGANRLAVAKARAKALGLAGRRAEARELIEREAAAGARTFPKEAAELSAMRSEVAP